MPVFLTNVAAWAARQRAWIALFASIAFSFFYFAFAREYQFEHGRFLAPAISTLYRAWWLLVGVGVFVTVLVVVLQGYESSVFQWRREKGLCIACQHPVGQLVICSECGHGRAVNPTCVSVRLCIVLVMVGLFLGVLAAAFLVVSQSETLVRGR